MALIKILRDGSYLTAAAIEATAAAKTLTELKKEQKAVQADLSTHIVIVRLKARHAQFVAASKQGPEQKRGAAANRARAVKVKIDQAQAKRNYPKLGPVALAKKNKALIAKIQEVKPGSTVGKPTLKTPRVLKPSNKMIKSPQFREPGTHGAPAAKAPRAPRKPSFDVAARRAATETTKAIRGELRDHAKTALIRIPAKPGATAPKAVIAKKPVASTVKHVTKPTDSATKSTLKVIHQLKADIAAGLTGAKLVRARDELKKNRANLRVLRAGKTAANQAHVTPKTTARKAGMGGAVKKASTAPGMGDASVKKLDKLAAELKALRVQFRAQTHKGPRKAQLSREIEEVKRKIAAMRVKV